MFITKILANHSHGTVLFAFNKASLYNLKLNITACLSTNSRKPIPSSFGRSVSAKFANQHAEKNELFKRKIFFFYLSDVQFLDLWTAAVRRNFIYHEELI